MKKHEYHRHPVTLTLGQFQKLRKGGTVQLRADQIDTSRQHKHHLTLHPENAKKVKRAARNRRGVRLSLSPTEFEMSGEGFGDFMRKLRDGFSTAGSWVKKNIIDTDVYRNNIRPIVRGLVDQGINAASALAGSKTGPAGQKIVGDVGRAAANKFYEATGAGMHRRGSGLRGGYEANRYGHGSSQGEVQMSARDVRKVLPASEFSPLLPPSAYPSLIQYSQAVKGRGMVRKKVCGAGQGRGKGGRGGAGGSFRL